MKFLVIILVMAIVDQGFPASVAATEYNGKQPDQLAAYSAINPTYDELKYSNSVKICSVDSSITIYGLKKCQRGDLAITQKAEKMYVKCMLKKLGVMSWDGQFSLSGFLALVSQPLNAKAEEGFNRCSRITESIDPTIKRAVIFANCLMKAVPEAQIT